MNVTAVGGGGCTYYAKTILERLNKLSAVPRPPVSSHYSERFHTHLRKARGQFRTAHVKTKKTLLKMVS
jgi:hypothetical protein